MNQLLNKDGKTLEEFLHDYDETKYKSPSVAVDIVLFTMNEDCELEVLLIRRGDHPYIGYPAFPGGFVEIDEEIDTAASRELMEETGVTGIPLRQFGTFGYVQRDPRKRVISVGYISVAKCGMLSPVHGDDAADARFYTVGINKLSETDFCVALSDKCGTEFSYNARLVFDGFRVNVPHITTSPLGGDHAEILVSALFELARIDTDVLLRMLQPSDTHLARRYIEAMKNNFFDKGQ